MARPVKTRNTKTYRRDVESLTRLRSALQLDSKLPREIVSKTCGEIDTLVSSILVLIQHDETEKPA